MTKTSSLSLSRQRQSLPSSAVHSVVLNRRDNCTSPTEVGVGHRADHSPKFPDFARIPVIQSRPLSLQTKLTLNSRRDRYEQEADKVADDIMRMPDSNPREGEAGTASRNEWGGTQPVRMETSDSTVPNIVHNVLKSGGQPLDRSVRSFYEARFGRDFSHVRVHSNQMAADSAAAVQARAYTVGSNIVFGHGEMQHGASPNQLLAHELTHVVQQTGTRNESSAGHALTSQPVGLSRKPVDPEVLKEVQEVESRKVQYEDRQISVAESVLQNRRRARLNDIDQELANVPPVRKAATEKKTSLEAAKQKTLEQIVAEEDPYIAADRREKILDAVNTRDQHTKNRQSVDKLWHEYDQQFASRDVTDILSAKGFTNAELKALVGQESLDLTRAKLDGHKDKAGIAQIGKKEAIAAGGKAADRLDPQKAIPLAAKVLVQKAAYLEKQLIVVPKGVDYKRFVLASYNAGQSTIAEAQRQAQAMNRKPDSWQALTAGGKASPLYKAVLSTLFKSKTTKLSLKKAYRKFEEISEYPDNVLSRIPLRDKGERSQVPIVPI